jgi:outer membrane protein
MKNLSLLLIIALFSLTTKAQTEKGKITFGGASTLSFSSTNVQQQFDGEDVGDEQNLSSFTLNTSAGYFIINNLSMNLNFEYQLRNFDSGDFENTSNTLGVFLGGNYFFEVGSEDFKPFVGASAGIISTSDGDEDSLKSSGFSYIARAGVSYFINQNVSIDFLVRYLNSNQVNKENSDFSVRNSNFGVGLGFSIFL